MVPGETRRGGHGLAPQVQWPPAASANVRCLLPAVGRRGIRLVLLAACLGVWPSAVAEDEYSHGAVATDHAAASQAGLLILKQGGNVVDAAVASSFALAVVRPGSCGLGGGGFMMIWNAESQTGTALDYRETAPAAASRNMFVSASSPEADSVRGGKAVAVPGTVAGLCYAAKHYGSLPLPTLLAPAIRLATDGMEIDKHDISIQRAVLNTIAQHRGYAQTYAELIRLYLNHGTAWASGDRFHSPLLPVLQRIADSGAAGLYRGKVAQAMIRATRRHGGILSSQDLESFAPKVRPPVRGQFRDAMLLSMPPPSSGGIALIQTLQTLEQWESATGSSLHSLQHNSADYVHVVSEAMKHAFADRSRYLGDADYVDVPADVLLSTAHAANAAARIDLTGVQDIDHYGRFFNGDDSGTSHVSVIDSRGNAVACTETINLAYGSFVVVPHYGIVLNNEMDDFSARPGEPNAFGLLQSEANAIDPGKKPLSSMTPSIVVRDGRAIFAAGASGGPRIISATLQVVINHLAFGMTPERAVTTRRFHHQWHPNVLRLEPGFDASVHTSLIHRGHRLQPMPVAGVSQAVSRGKGRVMAASDPRKHGKAAGF